MAKCINKSCDSTVPILVISGCPNHHIHEHYFCYTHFTYMKVAWHCASCNERITDYIWISMPSGAVRSSWHGSEYVADYWKEAPKWP